MKTQLRKSITGIVIVLALWQLAAWLNLFNPIYFASPMEVITEAGKMLQVGSIFLDSGATIYRIFISVFLAALVGIPLGILLGYFSPLYEYIGAIIDFLRSIPPIVIYPLLLILLGPNDSSRIGVALFGGIVVMALIISKGLFQQSPLRRHYFQTLGASQPQLLKDIVWYEALPHIMTALRTVISLTVIVIVVTEMMIGAKYGLGTRVQNVQITTNIPDLFTTVIVIGLIGVVLNKALAWVDRRLVFWKS
jgi:NitT/TauT family transport system permease protein